MTVTTEDSALLHAVEQLRGAVEDTRLPLDLPGTADSREVRGSLLHQLDDYILPRLHALDAPLLCVVGGSTGAGKSTLVNSVVGDVVTRSGVLRPTTRASVLVHHRDDEAWFTTTRILPGLARVSGAEPTEDDPSSVRLVSSPALPAGLGLLDAPDIDSVVQANRDLARQLMQAADLWLFVTTAARYADAVPWGLLRQASERGTSVAIVLDRVPPEAMVEVRAHLARMLADQGLGRAPIFTVAEAELSEDGRLAEPDVARLRSWLAALARDAHARSLVIRRTLSGALDSLGQRAHLLRGTVGDQVEAAQALREAGVTAYGVAVDGVEQGMSDGSLLRGEVLARWQELVGTGEFLRQVEVGVGRARDRLSSFFRGKAMPAGELGEALQTGAAALITAQGQSAAGGTARRWRSLPGGEPLLTAHPELGRASPELAEQVERLVRDWQREVFDLVREQAGHKRTTARYLAFGVNGIGVLLMIIVFSATAFIPTGAEVAVGGGSALLAQRLLEAVFGDQAVRELAARARRSLLTRTEELYAQERSRFEAVLDEVGVDPEVAGRLAASVRAVEGAR